MLWPSSIASKQCSNLLPFLLARRPRIFFSQSFLNLWDTQHEGLKSLKDVWEYCSGEFLFGYLSIRTYLFEDTPRVRFLPCYQNLYTTYMIEDLHLHQPAYPPTPTCTTRTSPLRDVRLTGHHEDYLEPQKEAGGKSSNLNCPSGRTYVLERTTTQHYDFNFMTS